MEFRILGPLEVLDDGELVAIGRRKHRQLLALLVINANRVVTTDRILEELWGDDAEGKENALWVYISRLRGVLGDSTTLVTRDHGYSLVVDGDGLDVHRFESAVEAGRALIKDDPAAASDLLSDGLGLWRGPALEEFTYDEFAQPEITRLEDLRLTAIEYRVEADLRRGLAGELVGELEVLQQAHQSRERVVGQLMLALYRAGRQTDALRAFERFRLHIGEESGLEPSPELRQLEERILLHDSRIQARRPEAGSAPVPTTLLNPFKGLRAFHEDDSANFFGRDRLVADVLRRIDSGGGLVGLVGPSGSGKSSIVRAGVVPALRKGALEGSSEWVIAQMVPGAHPFAELEAALLRSSLDAPDSLSDQLADPDAGILRAMLRVLPKDNSGLVLVVDQFEELFVLVDDETIRTRFMSGLLEAADDPGGRINVIFTLRADFYDRPLAHPGFGARMSEGIVNVVPMSPDELEAAAQRPAEEAGVRLEPALLVALLTDVIGQTGGLPLFQYTLTELFDRRRDDTLTLGTYASMGGVQGAVGRRADDLYDALDTARQNVARQLALRLVTIADGDQWGRRRVPASEILSLDLDVVALQDVIDAFTESRLLTLDRDSVTGSPTVEVGHEALLTNWGRLKEWIEGARDDLKRHDSLVAALAEWNDAGRNPDYLLSGPRLGAYERWAETSTLQLSGAERAFIDAGGDRRDGIESQRMAGEATARRSVRRRRLALVAVALVLAGVVGSVFLLSAFSEPVQVVAYGPIKISESVTGLAQSGYARAERELNVEVEYLGDQQFSDLEAEYRALGELGTEMVILDVGDSTFPWLEDVIRDYPDTAFVIFDPFSGSVTGASSIYFSQEQVGFMAGAAAAAASETGVIGFVGGIQWDVIEWWRAGYETGAKAVNPDVEILATYASNTYSDGFESPDHMREVALDLFRRGSDVVLAAAGTASLGAIEAARQHSEETGTAAFAIAPTSDWSVVIDSDLRPYLLTSALQRYDAGLFDVIRQYTEGELRPGGLTLALSSGFIGLAPSEFLTPAQTEVIDGLAAEVVSGARVVPRVPAGELIPPIGNSVVDTVTISWDGQACVISGERTSFEGGTSVRVEFVNLSSEYATLWSLHGSRPPPLGLPAGPSATTAGYLTFVPGRYQMECHSGGLSAPGAFGTTLVARLATDD